MMVATYPAEIEVDGVKVLRLGFQGGADREPVGELYHDRKTDSTVMWRVEYDEEQFAAQVRERRKRFG